MIEGINPNNESTEKEIEFVSKEGSIERHAAGVVYEMLVDIAHEFPTLIKIDELSNTDASSVIDYCHQLVIDESRMSEIRIAIEDKSKEEIQQYKDKRKKEGLYGRAVGHVYGKWEKIKEQFENLPKTLQSVEVRERGN